MTILLSIFFSLVSPVHADRSPSDALVPGPRGPSLELVRPLRSGARVLDLRTLGHFAVRITSHQSTPLLDANDMASVLATVITNIDLLARANDARMQDLALELGQIRPRHDQERRREFGRVWNVFRRVFLVYRLVESHRRFGSAEENAKLRAVFSRLTYDVVREVIADRPGKKKYPSDAQIVEILTEFRDEVGDRSGEGWREFLSEIDGKLGSAIEPTALVPIQSAEFAGATGGAVVGLVGFMTVGLGMVSGVSLVHDPLNPVYFFGGIFGSPVAGALAGHQIVKAWRPRRLTKVYAKIDEFVRQCQARLTD